FLPLVAISVVANLAVTQPVVQRWLARDVQAITLALSSGKAVWTDDDLRAIRAGRIAHLPAGPDVLILGGSRALRISEEWFRPRPALNAAVLGGDLDSSVSLFQLCLEAGKLPRSVLLELNPPLAHEEWHWSAQLLAPYDHALARYGLRSPLRRRTDYLWVSDLRAWRHGLR